MTGPIDLRPGDKLPFCYGMRSGGGYWSFEDQAGRPAVLIVPDIDDRTLSSDLVEAIACRRDAFAALGADIVVLASARAPGAATAAAPEGVMLVFRPDDALDLQLGRGPWVLASDRAMRLAVQADGRDPSAAALACLSAIAALPREPAGVVSCPAPALVVPAVLDAATCHRLIERFESGDHQEGAMASVDGTDGLVNRIDPYKKHRRDLVLDPAEPLHQEIIQALSTRLIPEIKKGFQAEVCYVDRILIARYDDTGGFFKRHRDDASPHVAFREFAVSLNLNTDEYEGGGIVFPEFNDCQHRPPAGSACVFSAALLHEAQAVTKGRRYVLLTFVHGQEAEARRLAGLQAAA